MTGLQRKLALLVLQSSLLFKHKAYVNEDEYRFLDLHQIGDVPGVKFRSKPNMLSRYREFNWRLEAPQALKSITVGPAADEVEGKRFAYDCLKAFCRSSGPVNVEKSQIPYRPR
jgi:hypothetical protein